jgi:hypothetical protein
LNGIKTATASLPATNAERLRKGALATTASAVARRAKEEAIHFTNRHRCEMDCFACARNDGGWPAPPNR